MSIQLLCLGSSGPHVRDPQTTFNNMDFFGFAARNLKVRGQKL
jgi:hypothetical protein